MTRLKGEVDSVMSVLQEDNQSAWVILSTALAHQLDYSLTLQYPSDMLEVAAELDARIWAALEQVAGQPHIPRREEGAWGLSVWWTPQGFQRWRAGAIRTGW